MNKSYLCRFLLFFFLSSLINIKISYTQEIKWFPGHYYSGSADNIEDDYNLIKDYTIVRGIQKRYYWDEMEISKDSYDFSLIINDLNYLQTKGLKLVIQIQFKTFNSNQKPYPSYLQTSEYEGGIYEMESGGWNLKLWNSSVLERLKALILALGNAVDQNPALVLVNMAESAAASPKDPILASGWSQTKKVFLSNLANCAYTFREAFYSTPTISYFNSGESDALVFEKAELASGHGHGGPDTYIGVYEKDLFLRHAYNLSQRMAGKVPIGYGIQWNNYIWVGSSSKYSDPRGAVPPVELYEFSRDVLKSNFAFWVKRDPYWENVKALWDSLSFALPNDPAGGLNSAFPTLLNQGNTGFINETLVPRKRLNFYPNPSKGNIKIDFEVLTPGTVELLLLNMVGTRNCSILNTYLNAAQYQTFFEIPNLSSGYYLIQFKTSNYSITEKLLVVE